MTTTPSTDLFVSVRESWLYDSKLSPEARIVGLYLARRFEMLPEWHPRRTDIRDRCGLTEYAARKALAELKTIGYLTGGKKVRERNLWRNTPYRATSKLRDAALYWRHKSPEGETRHPETRIPETTLIYPQNESDRARSPEDQAPVGKDQGKERQHPLICGRCGRGPFRGEAMTAHMRDAHEASA